MSHPTPVPTLRVGTFLWTLCILPFFSFPVSADGSFDQARKYFEESQSKEISDIEHREWLEKSLESYPTFKAHYELGKLERRSSNHEPALRSFLAAFDLTGDSTAQAQAAYQIGVTRYDMDHFVEARRWLRRSLGLNDHPDVRRALRELELSRKGTVLTAEEILRELKVTRSFAVSQAELRVNFEINRAALNGDGRRQAEELSRALSDGEAPAGPFLLLGHTDRICPRTRPDESGCNEFNLDLSEKRAESVRRFLSRHFGASGPQIRTLGCGRRFPLSDRSSPDDHYLNRRVVVMLLDGQDRDREELCGSGSGLL